MNQNTIRSIRGSLVFILDVLIVVGTFCVVYFYRIGKFPNLATTELSVITFTFICALFVGGAYYRERSTSLPRLPIRTFWICVAAGILCVGWLFILGPSKFNQYFGRGVLPSATLVCGILTTLTRFFINRIYYVQEQGFELLYLGFSESGDNFLNEIRNHSEVREITVAHPTKPKTELDCVKWTNENVHTMLQHRHWHSVIVDPEHKTTIKETEALVELRLSGIPVVTAADYYENFWFMVPVTSIDNDWFLHSHGFAVLDNQTTQRIKRLLDILFSSFLLVISLPVLIICALLIKLTSKGPILYRQSRVGVEGLIFTIVKLRTMKDMAELNGAQWAAKNDPRTTSIGHFLRRSRLDEIPQCWNILRGEMSFVGPRPERPEFTQRLGEKIPYYDLRHIIKPGLTGWAQVNYTYGASEGDALRKLQYDLYYIKNHSLFLDFNILLRTVLVTLKQSGR